MGRMRGVEPAEAGWLTRLIYWATRRKLGQIAGEERLVEPVKIAAHHPPLLRALGRMEMAQAAADSVEPGLRGLASIRAAMLIGCPY